jgi:hypothetical protein
VIREIPVSDSQTIATDLARLVDQIHQDIPEKRRISTGRYSIVKAMGSSLYPQLIDHNLSPRDFAIQLFVDPETNPFVRAIGLKLMAVACMENPELSAIQPYFETAAGDENWILRECVSGLVRPLINNYPEELRNWYLDLVKFPDPNQRRFVSESLRPVVENRWFHNQPEYALDIIRHLFKEAAPHPRTSVGNNLSDWMRVDHDTAWPIVEELAQNGDPNSYWIAYRACRNYVKKEPIKVMDVLGVDQYKYKNRIHQREDS